MTLSPQQIASRDRTRAWGLKLLDGFPQPNVQIAQARIWRPGDRLLETFSRDAPKSAASDVERVARRFFTENQIFYEVINFLRLGKPENELLDDSGDEFIICWTKTTTSNWTYAEHKLLGFQNLTDAIAFQSGPAGDLIKPFTP